MADSLYYPTTHTYMQETLILGQPEIAKTPNQLRMDDALHARTLEAYQKRDFDSVHFEIVNTIAMDATSEIVGQYDFTRLADIKRAMIQGLEAASNTFRKFSGENALPVYVSPDTNNLTQTPEYFAAYQQTGPIGAHLLQELFDQAGLADINAAELASKLSIQDLIKYSVRKVQASLTPESTASLTQTNIDVMLNDVLPPGTRYDFDEQVLASIKYDNNHQLSPAEMKATDLMFVFMNALWKVQQIHRSVYENRLTDKQLEEPDPAKRKHPDARIDPSRPDYRTYTSFLTDSILKHKDKSLLHGLIYAAYGVQKDLLIYLRNIDKIGRQRNTFEPPQENTVLPAGVEPEEPTPRDSLPVGRGIHLADVSQKVW